MKVHIQAQKLGRRPQTWETSGYELPHQPETLRELISMLVTQCVNAYNDSVSRTIPSPLNQNTLDTLQHLGKITFDLTYSDSIADAETSISAAITGFQDGLYRFFINGLEIKNTDAPLPPLENATILIIRLVMLTGGFL